jgi:hypothetical protein
MNATTAAQQLLTYDPVSSAVTGTTLTVFIVEHNFTKTT